MYGDLRAEQAALRPLWPVADGVDEPADAAFVSIMADAESLLVIGEIDQVPVGFCWARSEPLLSQAGGDRVGVVRLIYTDHEARGVGVGEAMIEPVLDELRDRGHHLFDARVSPGHRHAKNFFESNGFSARLIIMHHDDHR
jgi:GNAT superfamily N-acetyltransferase